MTDPVVRVGPPIVDGRPLVESGLVVLSCSGSGPECGELSEWESDAGPLQRQAKAHAHEHHDGLVTAEGWAR